MRSSKTHTLTHRAPTTSPKQKHINLAKWRHNKDLCVYFVVAITAYAADKGSSALGERMNGRERASEKADWQRGSVKKRVVVRVLQSVGGKGLCGISEQQSCCILMQQQEQQLEKHADTAVAAAAAKNHALNWRRDSMLPFLFLLLLRGTCATICVVVVLALKFRFIALHVVIYFYSWRGNSMATLHANKPSLD